MKILILVLCTLLLLLLSRNQIFHDGKIIDHFDFWTSMFAGSVSIACFFSIFSNYLSWVKKLVEFEMYHFGKFLNDKEANKPLPNVSFSEYWKNEMKTFIPRFKTTAFNWFVVMTGVWVFAFLLSFYITFVFYLGRLVGV